MKISYTQQMRFMGLWMILLPIAFVSVGCNTRESMDELGYELVAELERLPMSLQRIHSATNEESQAVEIAEMQIISEVFRGLSERYLDATPMSQEVHLSVNKRIRELLGEVEYRLLQMQDHPELVMRCSREIELIAAQLHEIEHRVKDSTD